MPSGERNKPLPRLAHKKSRTGCQRCRARRVKCDETRPVCKSCQRHNVPCFYDHDASSIRRRLPRASKSKIEYSTSTQNATADTERPPESQETRMLELRLLHQYTKQTSLDLLLSNSAEEDEIWAGECPRLAFDHHAVLYAMFALAALHIAKKDRIWPYSEAMAVHRRYLDLALPSHSKDVAHLSRENADASCVTSTFLRVCAFAYLSERPLEAYTPPMQWLFHTSSAVRIFHGTWEWIQADDNSIAGRLLNSAPALSPFNESLFLESNRKGFEYLVEQSDPREPWDEEIDHAYKVTVSYIGSMLVVIAEGKESSGKLCRRLFAFPLLVHPRFITLVEEQQPRALVILAHYFAIMARMRGLWWMGDSGRREIDGIQSILPGEWQGAMRWPLESVADESNVIV